MAQKRGKSSTVGSGKLPEWENFWGTEEIMVEEDLRMEHRSKLKMFLQHFTFIKLFQIAHSVKILVLFYPS